MIREVSALMRQSIRFATDDREASITWLLERGSALTTRDEVSRYLGMYANERTLDYGEDGRKAIVPASSTRRLSARPTCANFVAA